MKSRVEVNDNGEFWILIPEDIIDAYAFDDGDEVEWDANDPDFIILSHA